MKVYNQKINDIIRIQFGQSLSMSFTETNVKEVFDLFLKVFKDVKVTETLTLKNHCPLQKPSSSLGIVITVRLEQGAVKKGGSKSKTIFGLSDKKAFEIFKNNYQNYLDK